MWKLLSSYLTPPKSPAPSLFRQRENDSQDAADLLELTSLSKAADAETELQNVARCFPAASLVEPQHEGSTAALQHPLCDNEQLQQGSHSAGSIVQASEAAEHWLQAPADQRLVLSVLLELAGCN